jgi:hypothetical protein
MAAVQVVEASTEAPACFVCAERERVIAAERNDAMRRGIGFFTMVVLLGNNRRIPRSEETLRGFPS